jgi:hypothetical protein
LTLFIGLQEIATDLRDFLVVHLQDTERLFFLRDSHWQLLSLLSVSLIDQHLELQLFLPLFDSFFSVKLGLFHQGVKYEVFSLESVP